MAAKKRRRGKKRNPTTKKANPRRRKKRHNPVRAVAANPRRRRGRRVRRANPARMAAKNPRHKRRHRRRNPGMSTGPRAYGVARARSVTVNPRRKRRHRKNPGIPVWAMAAIAGVVGLAAYAVANAGTVAITAMTDPSGGSLSRNRYIAGGVLVLGGIGLAMVSAPIGAAIAAAGAIGLVGPRASMFLADLVGGGTEKAPRMSGVGVGSSESAYLSTGYAPPPMMGMGAVGATMGAVDATMMGLEAGAVPPWVGSSPF